jgi:hypothetical protein
VTEYNIQDDEENRYDEDDPKSWRNHCGGETKPLIELLEYYTVKWIGHAMNGWSSCGRIVVMRITKKSR